MNLRQTLQEIQLAGPRTQAGPTDAQPVAGGSYQEIASDLHRQLLDRIDLDVMGRLSPDRLREELRILVEKMIVESGLALNANERLQIVTDVQNEVMGLGPLEALLADPTISDILVNTYKSVYVERFGRLEATPVRFASDQHLLKIIDKIVSRVGRRIDESSPMVDARLPDGSRVNAVIPPLAIDGPLLSIRRFSVVPLRAEDLVRNKSMTPQIAELLAGMVRSKLNLLISGGTGSGKTTLLNILSSHIGHTERIVTIEDAAELQLQQPHVVRLETRPPNIEGKGEVTQRALVRNSLRMRPDRIILGEVRGSEAFDMLQAMNTGHEGSMATIHANTPRDGLSRMENMLGMSGMQMPPKAMRQQISSAISAIVQIARLSDGKRKILSVSEITGMEGDIITMQDIFVFEQTGVGKDGAVQGHFRATGIRPKFLARMKAFGVSVSDDLFDPTRALQ
jgi:pilus assembly protein CpaF